MATQMLARPVASEIRSKLARVKWSKVSQQKVPSFEDQEFKLSRIDKFMGRNHQAQFPEQVASLFDFKRDLVYIPPTPNDDYLFQPPRQFLSNEHFLNICSSQMGSTPPLDRKWHLNCDHLSNNQFFGNGILNCNLHPESIRVLQWNILSQSLGTQCDNFVQCPKGALDWPRRRFRILYEMIRHSPDIICLQEVDHFEFFQTWLKTLGFSSFFLPKPDSPCIHMSHNNGPDGCAIFFKDAKFDLVDWDEYVLDVCGYKGNQVLLSTILRTKETSEEFVVSTTHFKAKCNPLLLMIRREQSKDLLSHVNNLAEGRPIIVAGDFNAEPSEPAYQVMTLSDKPSLASAYCEVLGSEPNYTTWKHREDGEHIETLDYIFYSQKHFSVSSIMEMPNSQILGQNKLPSFAFPSDHMTLACDFKLHSSTRSHKGDAKI